MAWHMAFVDTEYHSADHARLSYPVGTRRVQTTCYYYRALTIRRSGPTRLRVPSASRGTNIAARRSFRLFCKTFIAIFFM